MIKTPTYDEILSVQVLPISVLVAAASGKLDLNALARDEMASRGLDNEGKWIGFAKARAVWVKSS